MPALRKMSTPITLHPDALALLRTLDESEPGSSARLIRLFIADAPALLSRIELGHERRDPEELNQASHFLRSSALALGATALADATQRLEHLDSSRFGSREAEDLLAELRVALRNALLGLLALSPEL
ncbi:MAG TPA: Hpt domain-containing protein [Chiayiivirga sp.]|nr:Hpt domain-containing protein [Chiayiivirga sp.]